MKKIYTKEVAENSAYKEDTVITHIIEYSAYAKRKRENEILREALEFYSCEDTWEAGASAPDSDKEWVVFDGFEYPQAGKTAREALKKIEALK